MKFQNRLQQKIVFKHRQEVITEKKQKTDTIPYSLTSLSLMIADKTLWVQGNVAVAAPVFGPVLAFLAHSFLDLGTDDEGGPTEVQPHRLPGRLGDIRHLPLVHPLFLHTSKNTYFCCNTV